METFITGAIIGILVGFAGTLLRLPAWLTLLLSPVIYLTVVYLLK